MFYLGKYIVINNERLDTLQHCGMLEIVKRVNELLLTKMVLGSIAGLEKSYSEESNDLFNTAPI